jgi:membrane protein DedA with SNARE-associated domain/rhodanese-related sulfurtransferase
MSIALLVAGAAGHGGRISLAHLLPATWLAAISGDLLLYLGGRYTGWWLLAGLCRLSTNPEQCIFRSANYFYRSGPNALLFAKFVPGLGSMAAPLAGSLNMRPLRFARLALLGSIAYTTVWAVAGYLFSPFIHQIEGWVAGAGHILLALVAVLLFTYAIFWCVFHLKSRRLSGIERVPAIDLYSRLKEDDPDRIVIIADVRSHGYYDPGMQRIKNSIRVEPNRLEEELVALREFMAPECDIYLYCSCMREATSVRVAYLMNQQNCQTKVIEGGLRAWVKAGGELEPVPEGEIQRLPQFD